MSTVPHPASPPPRVSPSPKKPFWYTGFSLLLGANAAASTSDEGRGGVTAAATEDIAGIVAPLGGDAGAAGAGGGRAAGAAPAGAADVFVFAAARAALPLPPSPSNIWMASAPVSLAESPVRPVTFVLMVSLGARDDNGRVFRGDVTTALRVSGPAGALSFLFLTGEAAVAVAVRSMVSWRICARRSRILARASINFAPLFTVVVGDSGKF